jgi:biotin carboxyl carrier protein
MDQQEHRVKGCHESSIFGVIYLVVRGMRGRAYGMPSLAGAGPMNIESEIRMPKLGTAMAEGVLAQWLVADGATVIAGEALCLIETDKVENEIEAPLGGVIRQVARVGETYPVGELLGRVE